MSNTLHIIFNVVDDRGDQTQYKYDAAGRRTEVLYPNGTKAMYTYDKADQVVGLKNIDKNGKVLSSFKYVYDASGQMIEETQTQQEEIYQRSYQYNKANEIIGFTEEHQGQITKYEYHYDGVGNRTGLTITGPDGTRNIQYTYNSTNQLITETEGDKVVHYEYDHNGNLIRKKGPGNQVEYYAYDEENRLVQIVEHQGKGQTFGYDSDGNRLFRTVSRNNGNGNGTPNHGVGNGKGQGYDNGKGHDKQQDKELNKPESYEYIRYINDISVPYPQVLMTADSKGTYRGVYTYGLERISVRDQVAVEGKPNNPLYYLYDGRGSVSQLTNTIGNVRDQYRYEPFGAPMPEGELEPDTRLLNNPYGYNGEDYDIESDLQYLRARYYDPEIGRFISEDSYLGEIMQPLTLNRYAYTENNPLMYQDPSGHWSIRGLWNSVKSAVRHVYKKYVAPVYKRYVAPVYKRYIAPKVNRFKRYVKHRVRKYVRKARRAYRRAKRWAERKIAAHKKKSRSKHVTRSKKQNQKPKSKYKNYAKQKASQVKSYYKSGCDGTAKIGKAIYKNGKLILDGVQLGLDIAGLVPGFGEIADGANALISLARGDTVGAMMSAAAMIPFAGMGATAAKLGKRGKDAFDAANAMAKNSDEVAEIAKTVGKQGVEKSSKGTANAKEVKKLNEWLSEDKELLDEVSEWYNEKPKWWGIDPENTDVFYRTPQEVKEIRKKGGESGGHHPHGLALGGPEGQKLTPTGETAKVKNPTHSQVTGLQRRVINRIKKKMK